MRYSTQIRSISYLKANAAELLETIAADRQPLVITQNGDARAVLQDVRSYEQAQQTLAMLKILALGRKQVASGELRRIGAVVQRLTATPFGY